ncbi:hypothetical protein LINPERHAP2_LOCUS20492, partial [Linum perenne]
VAHCTCYSYLFNCCHRISASDDCGDALCAQVCNAMKYLCSSCKLFKLKDSHGSVPNDGFGSLQSFIECLNRIWTNVQSHPAIRNG